jgi:hypothetical protein
MEVSPELAAPSETDQQPEPALEPQATSPPNDIEPGAPEEAAAYSNIAFPTQTQSSSEIFVAGAIPGLDDIPMPQAVEPIGQASLDGVFLAAQDASSAVASTEFDQNAIQIETNAFESAPSEVDVPHTGDEDADPPSAAGFQLDTHAHVTDTALESLVDADGQLVSQRVAQDSFDVVFVGVSLVAEESDMYKLCESYGGGASAVCAHFLSVILSMCAR